MSLTLIGRLTKDAEISYTPGGKALAKLSVARQRKYKQADGTFKTDFFDFVAWDKTAEFAHRNAFKGRLVAIDCFPETETWVDKTTGQKRSKVVFRVTGDIELLDKRPEGHEVGEDAQPSASTTTDYSPDDEADPFADEA